MEMLWGLFCLFAYLSGPFVDRGHPTPPKPPPPYKAKRGPRLEERLRSRVIAWMDAH